MKFCTRLPITNASQCYGIHLGNSEHFFRTNWTLSCWGGWNYFAISTVPFHWLLTIFWLATVQWNFLHSFLSLIPKNVFGFISKFQIFFEQIAHSHVRHLELFCDQYSSLKQNFRHRVQFHCTCYWLLSSSHSPIQFGTQCLATY